MSVPYDYDPSNIEHLRAVVSEQEAAIEYLRECCKEKEAENARLRDLMYERAHVHAIQHMTEDELRITAANALDENAKLRDSLKALMMGTNTELCADMDEPNCKECSMHHGKDGCTVVDAMELLGIDMYGEPLEVKS